MLLFVLLIMLYQSACNSTIERSTSFSFIETDSEIELLEVLPGKVILSYHGQEAELAL